MESIVNKQTQDQTELQTHLNFLEDNGWCIIPNILTLNQVDKTIDDIWNWLESLQTGISRHDRTTWTSDKWPLLQRGLVVWPPLYHEQFIWDIRSNEKVVNIFRQLLGEQDLLVSFDRVNLDIPQNNSSELWLHTDHGNRNLSTCYQSFITLEDTTTDDGRLIVMEGSHKLHSQFFAEHGYDTPDDWWQLSKSDIRWFISRGCKIKQILPCKGSLVLWNSKTIHCNLQPNVDSKICRKVIYVSMAPRSSASEEILAQKRDALQNGMGTTHWANKCITFPFFPCEETNVLEKYNWKQPTLTLTELGYRLAGFG